MSKNIVVVYVVVEGMRIKAVFFKVIINKNLNFVFICCTVVHSTSAHVIEMFVLSYVSRLGVATCKMRICFIKSHDGSCIPV